MVRGTRRDGVLIRGEGHDRRSTPAEIGRWLSRSAGEFTYTIEMTGATRIDDNHYDVIHHLEGNLPGGRVDLHFRFTLGDRVIAQLTIEE